VDPLVTDYSIKQTLPLIWLYVQHFFSNTGIQKIAVKVLNSNKYLVIFLTCPLIY